MRALVKVQDQQRQMERQTAERNACVSVQQDAAARTEVAELRDLRVLLLEAYDQLERDVGRDMVLLPPLERSEGIIVLLFSWLLLRHLKETVEIHLAGGRGPRRGARLLGLEERLHRRAFFCPPCPSNTCVLLEPVLKQKMLLLVQKQVSPAATAPERSASQSHGWRPLLR